MVLYPEVMRKAQAELDNIVGRGRVPAFGDQKDLPYVDALVKEVLRWRPVAPLGASVAYGPCLVIRVIYLSNVNSYTQNRIRGKSFASELQLEGQLVSTGQLV